jgi:hypothetical protein
VCVLRGGEDASDLCAVRHPPSRGKAWLACFADRGVAVGGLKDSVDPDDELAASRAVDADGLDLQMTLCACGSASPWMTATS